MKFNEKLVKLRKLKGLTQDELASAVSVSRQAVYKWESGQSYPEAMTLVAIKELLGISIDDLLDENYEVVLPEKKKKRISKAAKAEVENAAAEEALDEEPAATEAPAVVEASPAVEEVKAEEPAPIAEVTKEEKEEPKKKVGFFGRIFGRK